MDATCKPGELFSIPLFPGLAIDPAWIKNYPGEIDLVREFVPKVRVLADPYAPVLTRKAQGLAARIAQHFGQTYRPGAERVRSQRR